MSFSFFGLFGYTNKFKTFEVVHYIALQTVH